MIILFFGQPASGKTTLAEKYLDSVMETNITDKFIHIDGDKWRVITSNVNYSKEGRLSNLKSAFDMAIFLEQEGFTPILSFVTPYNELRKYLYEKSKSLVQIYLKYNEERGRSGYFAKDFEEPNEECLQLDTSSLSIENCLIKINQYVGQKSTRS